MKSRKFLLSSSLALGLTFALAPLGGAASVTINNFSFETPTLANDGSFVTGNGAPREL